MNNEEIAKIVAGLVYSPKKSEKDPNFAVQLLVEKLCIPDDLESYSEEDVRESVLLQLNDKEAK